MSDVIAATPREVTNRRSVGDWVQIIRADLRQSVEGIVTAGQHLEEAKHQVDHGEWALLLDNIGIKGSKARKFRAIGRHPVISNRSYWNTLPPSWTTLYELSLLPPDVLEARIAQGRVTPDIEGEDIKWLYSDVGDEAPPDDDRWRDRLKRVPHTALMTSWDQVEKFRDTVRHNLDVKFRPHERWGQDPEDRNHELTVPAMIMVSPDDVQELDRYLELHTGTSRRELMEEAVMTLCEGLRLGRKEHEERIKREERQKYEAAMTEKRPREALGDGVA